MDYTLYKYSLGIALVLMLFFATYFLLGCLPTDFTNRTYLSAYIKATYQVSFREWIATHRIEYAKKFLATHPKMTIAEVSEASGFLSLTYFTKIFTEKEGISPAKWKKQN